MVPEMRFPDFRGRDGWKNEKLGQLSTILRGGSPRPIDSYLTTDAEGLNWLKIGDVDKESKYISRTEERVKVTALSKTREVHPGDLIMSNSMSFGRPYILEIKSCIHDGWIAVTDISGSVSRDYLYYFILSNSAQTYFSNAAAGGGIKNLNADIIKLLPVFYPQLEKEQQKIADCLTSVDDLVATQAQKLDALKRHKKGLMQQLFPAEGEAEPKLRFPEFRDKGEWKRVALGEIAEIQLGKMLDKNKHTTGKLMPYLNNLSVRWNYVDTSNLPEMYFNEGELDRFGLRSGDVVVCEGGEPGRSAVWDGSLPALKFQKAIHRVRFTLPFEAHLLVHYLELIAGTPQLEKLFTGGGIKHLTREVFAQLQIPTTIHAEQQKIANCLSSIDELITAQSQKVEALNAHKKGLMQQLFPTIDEVME